MLTRLDYMVDVLQETGTTYPSGAPVILPDLLVGFVVLAILVFCFVSSLTCANGSCLHGFSILGCPFGFL
jgi:hypothetical protein